MGTHLVVGAGPVGTGVAEILAEQGEQVVIVTRSGTGPMHPAINRRAADAASVEALLAAAPDASAIYNCVNPAYHRWVKDWPPLAEAFLSYAQRTGAVLATCSNLYGYGPVDGPLSESLPLAATGVKGRVRADMWRDAKSRHDAGQIRATEVRGSDYIIAGEQSLIASSRVVPRILRGRPVTVLGSVDEPHSWTFPADVARLLVIVASDERAWGQAWHVPTNSARTQRQVVDELADHAGVARVPVRSLSPALVVMLGMFSPAIRELRETAYQRDRPFVLDDNAARDTFGLEPTPWPAILDDVLSHYRTGQP